MWRTCSVPLTVLLHLQRQAEPTNMASYFDEHDCEPTNPEEQYRQNALLELARWGWTRPLTPRHCVCVWDTNSCPVFEGPWCRVWTSWTRGPLTRRTGTTDFLLRLPKLPFRRWRWSSFLLNKQVTDSWPFYSSRLANVEERREGGGPKHTIQLSTFCFDVTKQPPVNNSR